MTPADPGHAPRILVGACGSVAVLNLHEYLLALRSGVGCELRALLTASAERFVRADAIGLFCDEVLTSRGRQALHVNHVDLAEWADLLLVLPATANILAEAAAGLAGSPLSAAILAAPRPVSFFPNMNWAMWENPAVQRNVTTLRGDGHVVIPPVERLAYQVARQAAGVSATLPGTAETVRIVSALLEVSASKPGPEPRRRSR
jgi:phosphopantothenoylcysteine synthetase/decarboxylase